ncbi:lamin tail domain-containing protein [Candidatus Uhrbacteria bacterium]|nr:lamin tail domain-containing protein [Candidatus Uhrbacteria bacterium]
MMLFNRTWLALVVLLSVVALPIRVSAASPTVVFSEIAWAGSSTSSSDEWIELTNLTAEAIDLSQWIITGAGSNDKPLTLPEGGSIAPYSTYLIANYENGDANTALAASANYATATLSLPNDGFRLALSDALGAQIDVAGADGSPFAGGSGGTAASSDGRYRSMARVDGLTAGDDDSAWEDATQSSGFLDGVQDLGTPGTMNLTAPVAPPDVAEEEVPSDAEATEASPTPEGAVLISEFVVDPLENEQEWIELVNRSTETIALSLWTLEDAVGKTTDLSLITLTPGSYAVVNAPLGKLNNDEDTIVLRDPTGAVIDTVSYGTDALAAPKDGAALARNAEGVFEITTTTTPGGENVIFVEEVVEAEEEVEVVEIEEDVVRQESVIQEVLPEPETEEAAEVVEVIDEVVDVETSAPSTVSDSHPENVSVPYTGATTLRFSLLYPNATGDDKTEEYLEIKNTGTESIDLSGWTIEDGSTDRYTFSESRIVQPGELVRIPRTESSIALNNTGDTLELLDPNEGVMDTVTYGSAAKGSTYAFMNGAWTWSGSVVSPEVTEQTTVPETSVPTISTPATKTSETSSSPTASVALVSTAPTTTSTASTTAEVTKTVTSSTVEQSKAFTDGTRVALKGTVTALPGTLSRQFFYLEDATGGIQVYLYDGAFPEVSLGETVRIVGELSTSHGERRVKLVSQASLTRTTTETFVSAQAFPIQGLEEGLVGSLLTVKGIVQSRESGKLVLEEGASELVVYLKSEPEVDANRFERGDRLTVTGILTSYDGTLRIRPRTDADIVIDEQAAAALALTTDETGSLLSAPQAFTGLILLVATACALGFLALRRNYLRRQPTLGTS